MGVQGAVRWVGLPYRESKTIGGGEISPQDLGTNHGEQRESVTELLTAAARIEANFVFPMPANHILVNL